MNDKTIKLLIIGESGVGKSSLIRRFVEDKFDDNHDVTIGMDFKSKVVNIDGNEYKLALWDTAGAERFRSLTPSFYRKALGAVLVYDITNRESLMKLEAWLAELENYSDNPNIATIVVGNKIDKERVISRDEGLKFARRHRALFLEASAKADKSVADVFKELVEKLIAPILIVGAPVVGQRKSATNYCRKQRSSAIRIEIVTSDYYNSSKFGNTIDVTVDDGPSESNCRC